MKAKKIPFLEYRLGKHACQEIFFKDHPQFVDFDKKIDLLWEVSLRFRDSTLNWQGMMHILHQANQQPGESSVVFLPMTNMYSGDKSCILSTLEFICNLAMKHKLPTIVTCDQPLYWKTAEIIIDASQNSNLKEIVLLLGCFHTLLNLLGAIGTLMEKTGLQDILETVYGETAVGHMLSGKAVQRAIRGHLLDEKCLQNLLVSESAKDNPEIVSLLNKAEELCSSLFIGETTLESAARSEVLMQLEQEMEKKKSGLVQKSKTSQLWLNCQRMVEIARSLFKADRTGSWLMNLQAVSCCLPVFAAASHFNYLRSAYYYLQDFQEMSLKILLLEREDRAFF